jgi:hypothetical protein
VEVVFIILSLLGVVLSVTTVVFYNKYHTKKVELENEVTKNLRERMRQSQLREGLRRDIDRIQKQRLRVGSIFYYPTNHTFVDGVAGKRAMIVELTQNKVHSRLIDENNNFIDDTIWNGDTTSSKYYIFVGEDVNTALKHVFCKEVA